MTHNRRAFVAGSIGAVALAAAAEAQPGTPPMYGLIGKMIAQPGQRDALAVILLRGTADMPGCRSYVIATDPADPDGLWITEVWDSQANHQASLALPSVQAAISQGRPLIAGMGPRYETAPVGGHGI